MVVTSPYRLTQASYSTGQNFTYTYDPVGNRLSENGPEGLKTYTYDAADRLTAVNTLAGTGGVAYTWDNNGNLLSDGQRTFSYDSANRLKQVVSGTLTTQYAYSGDGVRRAQTVNGVETRYVVDVNSQLPQVLEEQNGDNITRYLYGAGMMAVRHNGAWRYQHTDALGSVRQTSNILGAVQQSVDYDPFGNVLRAVGQPSGTFGFAHEQQDAASGLTFLRARYYDPSTGRFLTRDTYPAYAPAPQTLHRYVYVENNPVNHTDPAGLMRTGDEDRAPRAVRRVQPKRSVRGTSNWYARRANRTEEMDGSPYRKRTTTVRHSAGSGTEYQKSKKAETNSEVRTVAASVSRGNVQFAGGFVVCTTCRYTPNKTDPLTHDLNASPTPLVLGGRNDDEIEQIAAYLDRLPGIEISRFSDPSLAPLNSAYDLTAQTETCHSCHKKQTTGQHFPAPVLVIGEAARQQMELQRRYHEALPALMALGMAMEMSNDARVALSNAPLEERIVVLS